jgi:hypothetical protein
MTFLTGIRPLGGYSFGHGFENGDTLSWLEAVKAQDRSSRELTPSANFLIEKQGYLKLGRKSVHMLR